MLSIKAEMDRREKLRLEAIQEAERIKRETEERRTKRANLREKLRIHKIEQVLLNNILAQFFKAGKQACFCCQGSI